MFSIIIVQLKHTMCSAFALHCCMNSEKASSAFHRFLQYKVNNKWNMPQPIIFYFYFPNALMRFAAASAAVFTNFRRNSSRWTIIIVALECSLHSEPRKLSQQHTNVPLLAFVVYIYINTSLLYICIYIYSCSMSLCSVFVFVSCQNHSLYISILAIAQAKIWISVPGQERCSAVEVSVETACVCKCLRLYVPERYRKTGREKECVCVCLAMRALPLPRTTIVCCL